MSNFDINSYETVESRLKRYATDFPDFRVKTKVVKYSQNTILIQAWIYKTAGEQELNLFHGSGLAEETRGDGFVNNTSHVENCETSAVGRALANANYSGDKRPSREEMQKVQRLSTPVAPIPTTQAPVAQTADNAASPAQVKLVGQLQKRGKLSMDFNPLVLTKAEASKLITKGMNESN